VLRVSLRHAGELNASRLQRLHALARLERSDKARFIAEQLGRRMADSGPPGLQRAILDAAKIELPDDATLEQLDAWLELAELVSNPAFLAHYRAKPTAVKAPSRGMRQVREDALVAIQRGVALDSPSARAIARRWVRGLARQEGRRDERTFAIELLHAADSGVFAEEQRFWALLAILKPEMAKHPAYAVGPWLIGALRAWVGAQAQSFKKR